MTGLRAQSSHWTKLLCTKTAGKRCSPCGLSQIITDLSFRHPRAPTKTSEATSFQDPFRDVSQWFARRWGTVWILGSEAEEDDGEGPRMTTQKGTRDDPEGRADITEGRVRQRRRTCGDPEGHAWQQRKVESMTPETAAGARRRVAGFRFQISIWRHLFRVAGFDASTGANCSTRQEPATKQ